MEEVFLPFFKTSERWHQYEFFPLSVLCILLFLLLLNIPQNFSAAPTFIRYLEAVVGFALSLTLCYFSSFFCCKLSIMENRNAVGGKKKSIVSWLKKRWKKKNYVSNSVCVFVIWYKKKKTFFFLSFEFALLYWCQLLRKEVTFFGWLRVWLSFFFLPFTDNRKKI